MHHVSLVAPLLSFVDGTGASPRAAAVPHMADPSNTRCIKPTQWTNGRSELIPTTSSSQTQISTRRKPTINLTASPAAGSRDLAAANAYVGRLVIASNSAHLSPWQRHRFSKSDASLLSTKPTLNHGLSVVPNTSVSLNKSQLTCLYLLSAPLSIDGTPL